VVLNECSLPKSVLPNSFTIQQSVYPESTLCVAAAAVVVSLLRSSLCLSLVCLSLSCLYRSRGRVLYINAMREAPIQSCRIRLQ